MDCSRLLSSSLGQGEKKGDLEKPLSEAAWGLKAEGLQHSGTGIGQDTVNAWFLVKDQEELGFIFHVWDVARGQGALNPSGVRSLGGTHNVPFSMAALPRAGPSLLARDGATTPRDTRKTPRPYRPHGGIEMPANERVAAELGRGCRWRGPTRGVERGLAAPRLPGTYKGWAPPARLMLDLSVVLAARLSQFQQPVATATEL
ncbi:unnamed protein product [Coccothraustes coccothraustes]